ncbi:hypothetical protein [Streptomyces sp. NPDC008139]|uniref:hypothetical protein n=1 Tax=Streptomyces sp. NPDC008139 TaxID=3364814 RepID=UPI0036E970DA
MALGINQISALSGQFVGLVLGGLPSALDSGLRAQGVPPDVAHHAASLPPVSTVFSALLGVNPVQTLLGPTGVLDTLPAHNRAVLTGKEFFPHLISAPFHHGLVIVFATAAGMGLLAATASLLRGGPAMRAVTAEAKPPQIRAGSGRSS